MGALLGLACGDAVGTTVEFAPRGTFEPLTDMVGGGPFRLAVGAWTDDTSMAMCLAESILDRGGLDASDQLRRYLLWFREGYWSSTDRCFDIGATTASALRRFETTGASLDATIDEDAAANGSLMRLAPVAIRWWADPDAAAAHSATSSLPTHPAARPVDTCRLLGGVLARLIAGDDFDTLFDDATWADAGFHPEVAAIATGSWRTKPVAAIRGSGYCVDALEAALWAVHGADDFRTAVLRAANLGDDADTTAAIAGQIAGARWGASTIPSAWRSALVHGDRIEYIAHRLFDEAAQEPNERWAFDETFHAWWAVPGELLAGEYPGVAPASVGIDAPLKLHLLADAGVRTIIDLTHPADALAPYDVPLAHVAVQRALPLVRESHPIPDMGVVDDDGYDRICAAIVAASKRGAVFVHCWGGVGRTGTVVGCHLIGQGHSRPDRVLEHLASLRAGTRKVDRPSPETSIQVERLTQRPVPEENHDDA